MREIVLDTETTGLSPAMGDRLVEIGCVELINHIPSGRHYHVYINPQRPMPEEAFRVHGLGDEFLADKPLFKAVVGDFLDFIGDAKLIIHNAAFDIGFLNAELERAGDLKGARRLLSAPPAGSAFRPPARVSSMATTSRTGWAWPWPSACTSSSCC